MQYVYFPLLLRMWLAATALPGMARRAPAIRVPCAWLGNTRWRSAQPAPKGSTRQRRAGAHAMLVHPGRILQARPVLNALVANSPRPVANQRAPAAILGRTSRPITQETRLHSSAVWSALLANSKAALVRRLAKGALLATSRMRANSCHANLVPKASL